MACIDVFYGFGFFWAIQKKGWIKVGKDDGVSYTRTVCLLVLCYVLFVLSCLAMDTKTRLRVLSLEREVESKKEA